MDVREKLVELLERAFECFIDDPYCIPDEKEFADHLIANGVTVQEWISVKDRLPEVGQCVLVWCESRMFKKHITISTYMRTYSAERETYFSRRVRNVTHWMPLPQPPKGESG